jgi:hypothetical protein
MFSLSNACWPSIMAHELVGCIMSPRHLIMQEPRLIPSYAETKFQATARRVTAKDKLWLSLLLEHRLLFIDPLPCAPSSLESP